MKHFTTDLLGLPWEAGARGPNAFDCWGLVVKVYKEQRGITLSPYADINPNDVRHYSKHINQHADTSLWKHLQEPTDLCVVAMSRSTVLHHVGIYIPDDGGLVIHCHETSGVIIQPVEQLTNEWKRVEFYGYNN